ncbi:MAG: hypothetical protein IPH10_10830 [bacterium]|nr:hypothetical protein [bacterium]
MLRRLGGCLVGSGQANFTPQWFPYTGASMHLDFVNRRYYWNGASRGEGDFSAFSGGSFGTGDAKGFIPAVDASHNVKIAWADLGISAPFCMVSVSRRTSIGANQSLFRLLSDANNYAVHFVLSSGVARTVVNITAGTQAQVSGPTLSANTVYSWASNIETDAIRASVNGANAGTADTSATLPDITELVVGHNGYNAAPFLGSIRHLMLFTGSRNQTALNADHGSSYRLWRMIHDGDVSPTIPARAGVCALRQNTLSGEPAVLRYVRGHYSPIHTRLTFPAICCK